MNAVEVCGGFMTWLKWVLTGSFLQTLFKEEAKHTYIEPVCAESTDVTSC